MKKLLVVVLAFFALPVSLLAQQTIKGKVVDEEGNGVPNATVVQVKGTKKGTQTDASGNFTLALKENGTTSLTVSSVGYATNTFVVKTGVDPVITLEKKAVLNDEVVVVGYQSVKRGDMKAAVATLGSGQLKDIPVSSAAEALTGKLAGVQVVTSEGSPDAEINIRVRGGTSLTQNNSPIYIVDGVQTEDALKSIAPQDIESIDVIKDPSILSIYGARGANGVVVITTRTPKAKKFTVTYNGFVGMRELPKTLDLMDPAEFVEYQYENYLTRSDTAGFFDSYSPIDRTFAGLKSFKDSTAVNWQDEVFGRKAFNQTHNVSIAGGTKTTQLTFGYTHNDEDAIMINSGFKRNLLNFKITQKLASFIKTSANIRYTDQVVTGVGVSSSKEGQGQNRLRNAIRYRPYIPLGTDIDDFDETLFDETAENGLNLYNPVLLAYSEYKKNYTKIFNIGGSIDVSFTKYLSFKTTLGYNSSNNEVLEHYNTFTQEVRGNPAANRLPITGFNNGEKISVNNSNVLTFNVNKLIKKKSFKKHHDLIMLVGQETYKVINKQTNRRYGNAVDTLSAKASVQRTRAGSPVGVLFLNYPTYTEEESRLASFFGKVDYTLNKKYSATFSVRSDGASVLAPGHRWNTFTAGALTWIMSRENFFQKAFSPRLINDFKVRFSYGGAGNAKIDPFLYLPVFSSQVINPTSGTSTYTLSYSSGTGTGTNNIGYGSPYLSNGLLKWETTTTKNLGFDLGMFKNRFQLSVDIYKNTTKDLLLLQTIPATSGYTSQIQNAGQTTNKGIDVQLTATVVDKKNFTWSANFNIAFNKNRIDEVGSFNPLQYSGWSVLKESLLDYNAGKGMPVGEMYGFVSDGFYTTDDFTYNASATRGNRYVLKKSTTAPYTTINGTNIQPGMLKLKDLNGDSLVTDADRTVIGHAQPKFTGGLNQQFSFFKRFDLSVFVNWVVGNDVYNANKIEFTSGYTKSANMLALMNDRWKIADENGNSLRDTTPDVYAAYNANAKLWAPSTASGGLNVTSWAIEDGSFLRINNVSLGYNFAPAVLKKIKVTKLRVYATVNNLAVITNYSGYDPEANTRTRNPLTPGVDYSAYPRSRSYVAGINLTF
ncbi:SusC/RagA family TonB-linked outer membrane protein [Ferruginibacter sp. SUN002]|uniref:SusC/RagA family TonB-linked outer membrane protein n=1 Tax=Ferruginibacter sp. SUN002 TaxID=2937789 RepID=UPI003D3610FC